MERRNAIYGAILAILCVSIVVVIVLVLRKRASLPVLSSPQTVQSGAANVQAPFARPLNSYQKAPIYKEGDPVPQQPDSGLLGGPPPPGIGAPAVQTQSP